MNLREPILQAADHIEQHPEEFSFQSCCFPDELHCGTPGCAIGWIAFFALPRVRGTAPHEEWFPDVANELFGDGPSADWHFYARMNELCEEKDEEDIHHWMQNPTVCAATLRLYADKYYPETKCSTDTTTSQQPPTTKTMNQSDTLGPLFHAEPGSPNRVKC